MRIGVNNPWRSKGQTKRKTNKGLASRRWTKDTSLSIRKERKEKGVNFADDTVMHCGTYNKHFTLLHTNRQTTENRQDTDTQLSMQKKSKNIKHIPSEKAKLKQQSQDHGQFDGERDDTNRQIGHPCPQSPSPRLCLGSANNNNKQKQTQQNNRQSKTNPLVLVLDPSPMVPSYLPFTPFSTSFSLLSLLVAPPFAILFPSFCRSLFRTTLSLVAIPLSPLF